MIILLASTISIAFLHALAPDHWLPFVALAKGSRWKMSRLALVTALAGLGHVALPLVIGAICLWAGWGVQRLEGAEALRGSVAIWVLIGFGAAYAIWGLKHAQHSHPHPHRSLEDTAKAYSSRPVWILVTVLILGPCEPLIPLMFLSYPHGLPGVLMVSALFSLVTIGMIMGQSCLSYAGVSRIRLPRLEQYSHALAGAVIVITGLSVAALGL